MADSGWLRFLGGNRSRTSKTLSSPRSEPGLRLLHHSHGHEEYNAHHQRRAVSRLSSWHGLMKPSPTNTRTNDEPGSNFFKGGAELTWHSPSVDQMVDTLRVIMMAKPVLEPLPIEYHSHILHLIEGYSLVKRRLMEIEKEQEETERLRHAEHENFRLKQEDWMIREARYKAEVKRLEVVIHQTSDTGLEAVALARSGSLLRDERHNSARALTGTKGADGYYYFPPLVSSALLSSVGSACKPISHAVDSGLMLMVVSGEMDGSGCGNEPSHGRMLGHHRSIRMNLPPSIIVYELITRRAVSRPRIVDANSDVKLSMQLRETMKADFQGRRRVRRRGESTAIPGREFNTFQPTSKSSGTGGMAQHEDREIGQQPNNASRSLEDGDGSSVQPYPTGHRRVFSFVPGDDRSTIPVFKATNLAADGVKGGVELRESGRACETR
ncbi:hypothetical protein AK830_g8464 [Neonectria ditissima]|uniref:Uncharacterized protein n=1 Tax=Neonectria ditissima TaxID=78410 RepID=A0A0N8H664_9HYPO|nr:hypothetical protein AK830_g8464 [Neonectria ditissima]